MTDPSGGIIAQKLAAMLGGFFGGSAILTFIRPKTIGEAFTRGGISVGSAVIFATPIIESLNLSNTWEYQLMAGFCIGFVAYSLLGMVANFLIKNQNNDVVSVVKDIRGIKQEKSDK